MKLVPQIKRLFLSDTPIAKVIDTLLYAVAVYNGGLADDYNPWMEVGKEHSYYNTETGWKRFITHMMTVNQIDKLCDEHGFDYMFCQNRTNLFWLQDSLSKDTFYIYAKDCK